MVEFLRRTGSRFSKLGKGRKKKQKWRKPTGRDNKMREKRKGYPAVVKIGYKQDKKLGGIINEQIPVMIMNVGDLEKIKKNEIGIIGKIGQKKKTEIAKIAKAKKIEIYNLNAGKFLKKIEKTKKKIVEKKNQIPAPKKLQEKSALNQVGPGKSVHQGSASSSSSPSMKEDINTKGKTKLENNKDESKK